MHGAQYTGSLFFYLKGKDNNYKNSEVLLDEEAPVNPYINNIIGTANIGKNGSKSPKRPKLPIIANSITDNTFDPGAIIKEIEIDSNIKIKSNLDRNHKQLIHKEHSNNNRYRYIKPSISNTGHYNNLNECQSQNMDQHLSPSSHSPISIKSPSISPVPNLNSMQSSSNTSIDCDVVLDLVPSISITNCCNSSHRNNKATFTHIHPMMHPNMELDMYYNAANEQMTTDQKKNISTKTSNFPSKRKYSLDMHHHSNLDGYNEHDHDRNCSINLKAFEPDLLNIDRKDNNSYRDEDICDDEDWWMSGAYFDDVQLEFEYDPQFIYHGVEI